MIAIFSQSLFIVFFKSMGTPAARTGREDADSVLDYNFFYQSFNLLFSVREGGQVVDVHEGNLGTEIIPEAVEFFRILFGIDSYGTGGPSLLCPAGEGLCYLYEDGSNRRFHPAVFFYEISLHVIGIMEKAHHRKES